MSLTYFIYVDREVLWSSHSLHKYSIILKIKLIVRISHSFSTTIFGVLNDKFAGKNYFTAFTWTKIGVCGALLLPSVRNIVLISLTHVMVDKVLFWGQIFELEILMDSHFKKTPESENNIFSVWSVCLCVGLLST